MGDWERCACRRAGRVPCISPPPAEPRGGRSAWRDDGNCSGCVRLQSYVNSAAFFTLLHRQVLDLLDWPEGPMKFENRLQWGDMRCARLVPVIDSKGWPTNRGSSGDSASAGT